MYIVLGIETDGGEMYGKGNTLEEAVRDLESLLNPGAIRITHYYKCQELQVIQTRKFNIIE